MICLSRRVCFAFFVLALEQDTMFPGSSFGCATFDSSSRVAGDIDA